MVGGGLGVVVGGGGVVFPETLETDPVNMSGFNSSLTD